MQPEMLFPSIDLPGPPLWGFTYRLITEWLRLGPQGRPIEEAGFHAASALLDFLIARGLHMVHGWEEREGAKAAAIDGPIPTAMVLARIALPASTIPQVNLVEVRPDYVRVVGLGFEEYIIRAHSRAPADTAAPRSSSTADHNRPPR